VGTGVGRGDVLAVMLATEVATAVTVEDMASEGGGGSAFPS
jgi:hypothetical protein